MVDSAKSLNFKQFWTVGSGSSGLLLNGSLNDIHNFQKIDVDAQFGTDSEITQLELDGMMGFYLNSKGEVYKYGECEYDEKNKAVVNPIPHQIITFKTQVIKISCGWSHAIFLDKYHKLYGVGSNKFGELGFGNNKKLIREIEEIPFSKEQSEDVERHEIQDIKCAFRQSFIVTKQYIQEDKSQSKYTIYCTGQNKSFELGGFQDQPILYHFKENTLLLHKVGSILKFICGYKFGCILNTENNLYGYAIQQLL